MKTSKINIFWIKLTNWEYWPWYIVYIPIFAYWLWCGLRVRAIFYISAANPGFEYGGVIGSSKKDILDKISHDLVPKSIIADPTDSGDEIIIRANTSSIHFPFIVKPDIGERGFNVELIKNKDELDEYRSKNSDRLIIQEYIDLPLEAGVFYYRMPNEDNGIVSSVVLKGMLSVTGDGKLTIGELMQQNDRAKLQIGRLTKANVLDLESIPEVGESILLEPIGNHNRGTMFLDGCSLINQRLIDRFDAVSKKIDGFYYGRYDIRCKDKEALYKGEFKIMELNGSASEPAHIYSPGFPLIKGYRTLFAHWQILFKICKMNHKNGVPYMSFRTGWGALKKSRFTRDS